MNRTELFNYIKQTYQTHPEYLWKKFPNYAVFRHQSNNKWYAIVMGVEKSKLGLDGDEKIDILDIKIDPKQAEFLLELPGFLPGYHMNHRTWLTVLLDGTVPDEQIAKLLAASFQATKTVSYTHLTLPTTMIV